MTSYIQHQKTADEVVADLDGQITERLARNFGNMTLWHADAATLLRRYREMAGEISTLRAQQETDRATIAALSAPSPSADALRSGEWRPIESAPKDGRDLLIVDARYGHPVRIGFWDEGRGGVWSIWPGRERIHPTHWRPLPASPNPTGEV